MLYIYTPGLKNDGAFPLCGTTRLGLAWLGLCFHCSLVPLQSGWDYSHVVLSL